MRRESVRSEREKNRRKPNKKEKKKEPMVVCLNPKGENFFFY